MALFYLQFVNGIIIGKTLLLVCFVFHLFLVDARHLEIVRLGEIQKCKKNLCDLIKQFETQLCDHHKSVGTMLTDHVSGVDTKVTRCCETLGSNSSSASSSVVVNVVPELEDTERRKKNVLFLTFLSQMYQIWRLMFPSL